MIVKMKKYDFLIYHKDYQSFLLKLRDLGVVHVKQKQFGNIAENSELADRMKLEKRYQEAILNLEKIKEEKGGGSTTLAPRQKAEGEKREKGGTPFRGQGVNGAEILENIESLFTEKDKLNLDKQGIKKEIDRIVPLGDFEPANIQRLAEKGWHLHFHVSSQSKFDEKWLNEYDAFQVAQHGSQIYFATFTQNAAVPPIEAEHIRISEKSITGWKKDLEIIDIRIAEIENLLKSIAKEQIETLRYFEKKVKDEISFEKVELSGDKAAEEKLLILEGYVPEDIEPQTTNALGHEAVYFNVSIPTSDDTPPVKLKNNRFAKTFELIANLYDKPKYGT
jgi:V/A-type H+-transporting ATPase subunit I